MKFRNIQLVIGMVAGSLLFTATNGLSQVVAVARGGTNTNVKGAIDEVGTTGIVIWEVSAGMDALNRDAWKAAKKPGVYKSGAVLDNGKVAIVAAVGGDGVILIPADRGIKASAQIVPVAAGKGLGKITGVKLEKKEEAEVSLKVTFAGADLSIGLRQGQLFAVVVPGKGIGAIEVGGKTAYTIMPDFFGHDVIFDPKRFKSDTVTPPAENFLLNMQAGGDAIVMCVWQGPLSLGKETKVEEKDPRVDLVFVGQGKDRYVAKTRHECDGKPLYVAMLAKKGQWVEKDISADIAQKPMELKWDRPYEAKWRADFLGKEGTFCNDFMVKDVSWDVTYDSEHWGRRTEEGHPGMWFQGAWYLFTLPAWIQDKSTKKTFISIYSDCWTPVVGRLATIKTNEFMHEQAKKEKKPYVQAYPTNAFDKVIVYPIDRRKETPLTEMTPTDVMRECLGVGPCEYVLDLEGLKAKTTRNGRQVEPTCWTYDGWLSQFEMAAKGQNGNLVAETRDGKKGVPLAGLKPGEKFKPEDEAILVDRLEDLAWFYETINKRLHVYNKFGKDMVEFCNAEVKKNPALKSVADTVIGEANIMLKQCSDERLAEMTKIRDRFSKLMVPIVAEVKSGVYKSIRGAGNIRDEAVNQDNLVGVCHRCVKGMRQSASVVDSSDPEVAKFGNKIRSMCHDMLRSKGHFEH